jgi:SecY interacting protein Syd
LSVQTALSQFVSHYEKSYPELTEIFDPEWRSPCETSEPYQDDDGIVRVPWSPLARGLKVPEEHDFAGLENALETEIHPDIKAYYGSFWSGGLEAEAPQGHVSLILLWNAEDASRLIENLIGHALAKRRARAPLSVFFACTDQDSELFLSVENTTGEVLIEKPGHKPVDVVAGSLASFIDSLVPAPPELHPERSLLR